MYNIILKSFIPEIFLSLSLLFQLVFNIRLIKKTSLNYPIISHETYIQTLFILICLAFLYSNTKIVGYLPQLTFVNDTSILLVKFILTVLAVLVVIIIKDAIKIEKINFTEYYTIFLLGILSLLIMISSQSLLSFYLAMEMQALSFYILAAMNRNSFFSVESGMKYFLSGAFMSGFYLLGASMIYGYLGTLELNHISTLLFWDLSEHGKFIHFGLIIAFLLIISSILFKLACAPFHNWAPDVYDGAPLSSASVFSILPKIPLFYFFIKFLLASNTYFDFLSTILLVFGLFSAFIGTFYAFKQTRVKRLFIYSSIAQTGFLVSALSVQSLESISNIYFFLLIYLIGSLVIWGHLISLNFSNIIVSNFFGYLSKPLYITDFSNMFKTNKILAFSFLIVLFSVAGIPPLTGFLSKMQLILVLVGSVNLFFPISLIIISAISVYYYLRFIKIAFFESKDFDKTISAQVVFGNSEQELRNLVFSLLLFLLILLFFFPTQILAICQYITININLV